MTTPAIRTRRRLERDVLLRSVADHLLAHGLHAFTLRRAAEAAGTTHKVLLDKFGSADNLITEALNLVREQRATSSLLEATGALEREDLVGALRSMWKYLVSAEDEARLLFQGLGWSLAASETSDVGRQIIEQYLVPVRDALPAHWRRPHRAAVATLIVSTTRGLLIDRLATGDRTRTNAAFEVFVTSLTPLLEA
jgi:hypothetical protein